MQSPFREPPPPGVPRGALARELRAMTGYEEELVELRRNGANTAALCNELLARCLVPPATDPGPQRERVRSLLVARRDQALVALRRLSLGDDVRTQVTCPSCEQTAEASFDLSELPVDVPDAPERIEVALPGSRKACARLPTAGDQEDLLESQIATESERRTWLLSRVLLAVGDRQGPLALEDARALPIGDRKAIEDALEAALPDFDLGMEVTCANCGHRFVSAFDVAAFFLPR